MIVVGLTGSIAMGKSETAKIFRSLGIPVFDSDAEVHRLYQKGGAAIAAVAAAFPEAVKDGAVDREALSKCVLADEKVLRRLEEIVHPFVRKNQETFLARCRASHEPLAVLDVPMLFETGLEKDVDAVVLVSAPSEVQRQRVMARPGMTEEKFRAILARQLPDGVKRSKADYVVDTSSGLDSARAQVRDILANLRKKDQNTAP